MIFGFLMTQAAISLVQTAITGVATLVTATEKKRTAFGTQLEWLSVNATIARVRVLLVRIDFGWRRIYWFEWLGVNGELRACGIALIA